MPSGKISLKLRPLRIAFLIDPNQKSQLEDVIKFSSFLWGGLYNPIIPITKRVLKIWRKELFKEDVKSLIEGYIDCYDPDYVIKFDSVSIEGINLKNRKVISFEEIKNKRNDTKTSIGISIYNIMDQIYEDEFKFIRKHPYQVCLPQFNSKHNLFFSSVFGNLSNEQIVKLEKYYVNKFEFHKEKINLANFSEQLQSNKLFLRRIGNHYIKNVRNIDSFRAGYVFILQPENIFDIIDYWNLRAAGLSILPVPIQTCDGDDILKDTIKFIDDYYYKINDNNVFNKVTVLKSRSLTNEKFEKFINSQIQKENHNLKFVKQSWFPRLWNEFYRKSDHVGYCETISDRKDYDISDDSFISLDSLTPKFPIGTYAEHGQFVNEVEINLFHDKRNYAEVIPEVGAELFSVLKNWGEHWRVSQNGLFFVARHNYDSIAFTLPTAEDTFKAFFKTKNLEITHSNSGNIAKQIFNNLKSANSLNLLRDEELIKLLIKNSTNSSLKTISFEELLQVNNRTNLKENFNIPFENFLSSLILNKILQLGILFKCPTCFQYDWYPLQEVNYEMSCSICFTKFPFPSAPNKIQWRYKQIGPFSFNKHFIGVFTTLLCLHFFIKRDFGSTTSILSFEIDNKSEIDLAILLKSGYKSSGELQLLFFECKTYNDFDTADIKRMDFIARTFPGSIIVFATLKKELSQKEKKILKPFVVRGRRYWKSDGPINPVLILTGNELFSYFPPPMAWKNLGGKFSAFSKSNFTIYRNLFEFCDVTQQLYLDMESWYTWLRKKWNMKD